MPDADRDPPRDSPESAAGQGSAAAPGAANDDGPAPSLPTAVSLMITRRQKEQLRLLGFSDEAIRDMTPAEAHASLGL